MVKGMNKIEKLIDELCPDGVEFKDVGTLIEDKTVTTVNPPKKLTKKYYKPIGTFPIVDQGQKFIVGYTNDSNSVVANGLYVIFGDHTLQSMPHRVVVRILKLLNRLLATSFTRIPLSMLLLIKMFWRLKLIMFQPSEKRRILKIRR